MSIDPERYDAPTDPEDWRIIRPLHRLDCGCEDCILSRRNKALIAAVSTLNEVRPFRRIARGLEVGE